MYRNMVEQIVMDAVKNNAKGFIGIHQSYVQYTMFP